MVPGFLMAGCLAGWPSGWLAGCLAGWLLCCLRCWLAGRRPPALGRRPAGWPRFTKIAQLAGCKIGVNSWPKLLKAAGLRQPAGRPQSPNLNLKVIFFSNVIQGRGLPNFLFLVLIATCNQSFLHLFADRYLISYCCVSYCCVRGCTF